MRRSAQRDLRLATRDGGRRAPEGDDGALRSDRRPYGPNADRTVSPTLDRLVPEYDAHEEIYTAAMPIGSHENDVGFLFGMIVGERRAAMRVAGGA
jgi:hypothetical protein